MTFGKDQFEKPLKVTKIFLLLSGINLYKTKWHPILEKVINNFIYYLNIVILHSVISAEIYWLIDGIQTGRDFVEMSLTAPCITMSILSTLKTVPLFFNKDLLCQTIDTLKEIHPEPDYKKNTGSLKKKQNTKEVLNLDKEEETEEIIKESVKLLMIAGYLLLSFAIAVLITFLLAPLVLIYWKSFTTGQIKIKYPFYVKYWFDAYEVKFWPLVYSQQVWATIVVLLNVYPTETLFYTLCTYIEMHFRILCLELGDIQADSGTQEALVAGARKHQLLINLVEKTEELFSWPLLIHFVSSSILICLSAFNITVAVEMSSVFAFVTFLMLTMLQVSLLCFFGDKLMRSSTEVGGAIYKSSWYDFNVIEKKAVLIMIVRSQKPCKLTACNFADLNLRAFTTILSRSWSYFALLKTVYN